MANLTPDARRRTRFFAGKSSHSIADEFVLKFLQEGGSHGR